MTHWVKLTGYCDVPDDDWDDETNAPTPDGLIEVKLVGVGELDDLVIGPDDRDDPKDA